MSNLKLEIDGWKLTVSDGKRSHFIAIPPRAVGIDFIDRNFKYFYDYTGCIGRGILIKIDNNIPKAVLIDNHINKRIYKANGCFKEYNRHIK